MHRIRNFEQLARTSLRRDALEIAEAALESIDTGNTIRKWVTLSGSNLHVRDQRWNLDKYRRISLIGIGKSSCDAAIALESILGDRLHEGISLGLKSGTCQNISVCEATHPMPSETNVRHTQRIVEACEKLGPDDLVIVIISGGGSSMLCWPQSECDQGQRLYVASKGAGLNIHELNTVRKHISQVKGGGLARLLWPAEVISLIFSDVPGDTPDIVASGPTYFDGSTSEDARRIIDAHHLGTFDLTETPKDKKYFEKVANIVLVTNRTALDAMATEARELGYRPTILSDAVYDRVEEVMPRLGGIAHDNSAVIAGGEPRIIVPDKHGTGGRNQQLALEATKSIGSGQVMLSLASDGQDNGESAGAIVSISTQSVVKTLSLDIEKTLRECDASSILSRTNDLIMTGNTGSNVSDLMLLLTAAK